MPGSVHIFPAADLADQSWEYIKRSQTHECQNWDCGCKIPFLGIAWAGTPTAQYGCQKLMCSIKFAKKYSERLKIREERR
jgi:hypothetical protein